METKASEINKQFIMFSRNTYLPGQLSIQPLGSSAGCCSCFSCTLDIDKTSGHPQSTRFQRYPAPEGKPFAYISHNLFASVYILDYYCMYRALRPWLLSSLCIDSLYYYYVYYYLVVAQLLSGGNIFSFIAFAKIINSALMRVMV